MWSILTLLRNQHLMGKVDFEGVLLERTKLESLNTNDRAKNDRIKLNFPVIQALSIKCNLKSLLN